MIQLQHVLLKVGLCETDKSSPPIKGSTLQSYDLIKGLMADDMYDVLIHLWHMSLNIGLYCGKFDITQIIGYNWLIFFFRSDEYYLPDCASYFLSNVERLSDSSYVPTTQVRH